MPSVHLRGACLATLFVCTLTTATPAGAAIITVDLADHILGLNEVFNLDIDGGGSSDIRFVDYDDDLTPFGGGLVRETSVQGLSEGSFQSTLWLDEDSSFWAAPLTTGFDVTSSAAGIAYFFLHAFNDGNPWQGLDGSPGYIGGVFDLNGAAHAFRVLLSVDTEDGSLTLHEAAYDSESLDAAPVPEPATLSLLVVGAAGVLAARRRRVRPAPVAACGSSSHKDSF